MTTSDYVADTEQPMDAYDASYLASEAIEAARDNRDLMVTRLTDAGHWINRAIELAKREREALKGADQCE
jgi:hypothetical protein